MIGLCQGAQGLCEKKAAGGGVVCKRRVPGVSYGHVVVKSVVDAVRDGWIDPPSRAYTFLR